MTMTPPVLPIRANEAAALADLVYRQLEGKPLASGERDRFAASVPQLGLETFTLFPGSLARDPDQPSTYYIAIDTAAAPLLLRIALASSPAAEMLPDAMLIGRMRPGGGREIVIEALPFPVAERDTVRTGDEQAIRQAASRLLGKAI
jgi:hypothetical protein